ncbi:MAG TPA: DMT family transporter [Ottowia sp.]|uniref:DMT family transporter n=1 Tax=Ottowia sp. TaxID=1898956 RepID=UPI002B5E9BBC|nr:DMT family transporter [Ottowia sp.]HMN22310.1 DMT family transporter [Ottowia sp.]
MRLAALTTISMLAFAANSVLARLALGGGHIDPLAYSGIRLGAGACVLAAIALWRARRAGAGRASGLPQAWLGGSRAGALSLLLYAVSFSIAYGMVATGPGALILFASVQFSMLAWAVLRGDRPARLEWLGIGVALAALVYLVSPGLVAPPLAGAALMAVAGAAWGAYSLIGRGSRAPLSDSAGNFLRCAPVGVLLIGFGAWRAPPGLQGVILALASGALASGLGYIVWYSALPGLSRAQAALVQLTVPALAAAGGIVFIGEALTPRLVIATVGITGGVALALLASQRRAPRRRAGP